MTWLRLRAGELGSFAVFSLELAHFSSQISGDFVSFLSLRQDSKESDNENSCKDGGEKACGASVIAHGDAAKILQSSKETLDHVALSIKTWIETAIIPLSLAHGDARADPAVPQGLAQAMAVIGLISNEGGGRCSSRAKAALPSLNCPAVSNKINGLPSASQTACNLAFSPPLVCPRHRCPFFSSRLGAVRCALDRRGIDDERAITCLICCQSGKNALKRVLLGPLPEPVVERLVRAMDRWRILPAQTVPDDVDNAADRAPVIHPWLASGVRRQQWLNAGKRLIGEPEQILFPLLASKFPPTNQCLGKKRIMPPLWHGNQFYGAWF